MFLGTCEAVRAMHHYVAGPTAVYPPTPSTSVTPSNRTGGIRDGEEDDEDENEDGPIMTGGEGEALIGGMGGLTGAAEEEGEVTGEQPASGKSLAQPWAHRDIKPVSSRRRYSRARPTELYNRQTLCSATTEGHQF